MNIRSKFFKQPYGDQGLIIHRTTYFRNNGFRKIPLMEDVDFLRDTSIPFTIFISNLITKR